MLLLASVVGFVGCILFILLLIVLILLGKKATGAVVGFALSIALLLGGGALFVMTERAAAEKLAKPANVQPASVAAAAPDEDEPADAAPEDGDTSDSDAEPDADVVYRIGDTWTVDGQWSVTVTGVTETSERNRYSDKNPEAVYILDFIYTNLGYEREYSDGIFISLGDLGSVVDNAGMMAYSYPLTVTNYPQSTPVGAACTAQSCIGVDHAGDFKIIYTSYDGNGDRQTATFEIEVD